MRCLPTKPEWKAMTDLKTNNRFGSTIVNNTDTKRLHLTSCITLIKQDHGAQWYKFFFAEVWGVYIVCKCIWSKFSSISQLCVVLTSFQRYVWWLLECMTPQSKQKSIITKLILYFFLGSCTTYISVSKPLTTGE